MAAVTSYGVYYSQYLVLLVSTAATTLAARVFVGGPHLLPEAALFALFVPLLAMTAKRYGDSLASSLNDQFRAEGLVAALSSSNAELQRQNDAMARHRHVVD